MAKRKKKIKKLSDDETDELINDWISAIDDFGQFFFEHTPEEEGDVFYDGFLEKFQIVEKIFHTMLEQEMIVEGTIEDTELEESLDIEPKQIKGQRNDN